MQEAAQKEAAVLKQEALMALAILAALEQESRESPTIESASGMLFKLGQAGIDLGEIALRRVPGGYYSEDLEKLVGHYLASGYAEERSPVRLTPSGMELVRRLVKRETESSAEAARAARVLGVRTSPLSE